MGDPGNKEPRKKLEDDSCTAGPGEEPGQIPVGKDSRKGTLPGKESRSSRAV